MVGWGPVKTDADKMLSELERAVLVESLRKAAGMGGQELADNGLSPQHRRAIARDLYFRYLSQ